MSDIVERLRKPIYNEDAMKRWDHIRELIAGGNKGSHPRDIFEADAFHIDEERAEAATEITRLRALVEEMGKALEPFREEASRWKDTAPDDCATVVKVSLGHCRRARATLAKAKEQS